SRLELPASRRGADMHCATRPTLDPRPDKSHPGGTATSGDAVDDDRWQVGPGALGSNGEGAVERFFRPRKALGRVRVQSEERLPTADDGTRLVVDLHTGG